MKTEIEILHKLRSIVADLTGRDAAAIGADEKLADLGLDSLETVELAMGAEDAFGVELPDEAVSAPDLTLAGLAAMIEGGGAK